MPGSGNKGDRGSGMGGGVGGGNAGGGMGGGDGGAKGNFAGGDTTSAAGGNFARVGNFVGGFGQSSASGMSNAQARNYAKENPGMAQMSGLSRDIALGRYGAPTATANPTGAALARAKSRTQAKPAAPKKSYGTRINTGLPTSVTSREGITAAPSYSGGFNVTGGTANLGSGYAPAAPAKSDPGVAGVPGGVPGRGQGSSPGTPARGGYGGGYSGGVGVTGGAGYGGASNSMGGGWGGGGWGSSDRAPGVPGFGGDIGDPGVAGVPGGVQGRGNVGRGLAQGQHGRGDMGGTSGPNVSGMGLAGQGYGTTPRGDPGVAGVPGGVIGRAQTNVAQAADQLAKSKWGMSNPDMMSQIQQAVVSRDLSSLLGIANPTPTQAAFAAKYAADILRAAALTGVSPNVVAAQWGLESAWGRRPSGDFNLAGIKGKGTAGSKTVGTKEQIGDKMVSTRDKFRSYRNPSEFADDYAGLINRRYGTVAQQPTDAMQAAEMARRGWATDKNYAGKVAGLAGRMGWGGARGDR